MASLECTLKDATGQIVLVFLGRRHVAGIDDLLARDGIAAAECQRRAHHGKIMCRYVDRALTSVKIHRDGLIHPSAEQVKRPAHQRAVGEEVVEVPQPHRATPRIAAATNPRSP